MKAPKTKRCTLCGREGECPFKDLKPELREYACLFSQRIRKLHHLIESCKHYIPGQDFKMLSMAEGSKLFPVFWN
jgi:hypothetical protein